MSSNCSSLLSSLPDNIENCVIYESSESAAESFQKCTGNNGSLSLENLLTTAIRKVDNAASMLQAQEIIQKGKMPFTTIIKIRHEISLIAAKATWKSISDSLIDPNATNGQMPFFGGLPDGLNSILSNLSFPDFGSNIYSTPQVNYSLPNLGSFNFSSDTSLPTLLTSLNLKAQQGLRNLKEGALDNLFGQVLKSLSSAQGSLNADSLVERLTKNLHGSANTNTNGVNFGFGNKK